LPTIIGLSQEGISQSEKVYHKDVFVAIQEDALAYKRRMDEGQLTEAEMDEFSTWLKDAKDEVDKIYREWGICVINTDEFTNRIAGLAGEAIGFTKDDAEKGFMKDMRDMARTYNYRLKSGNMSEKEAEAMREWAREMRRRITDKIWVGDLPKSSRKDEEKAHKQEKKVSKVDEGENCPTCTVVPDKYKKKNAEEDYRYVSVDDGSGELKGMEVPTQSENQDVRWIMR